MGRVSCAGAATGVGVGLIGVDTWSRSRGFVVGAGFAALSAAVRSVTDGVRVSCTRVALGVGFSAAGSGFGVTVSVAGSTGLVAFCVAVVCTAVVCAGVARCGSGSSALASSPRVASHNAAPAIANTTPPQTKALRAEKLRGIDGGSENVSSVCATDATLVTAARPVVSAGPLACVALRGAWAGTLIGNDTGVGAATVAAHAPDGSASAVTRE